MNDTSGNCDQLFVVPVGSKQQFAPWIRLLQSYGDQQDRPINWLVAVDSDGATDVRAAFRDASISLPSKVLSFLGNVANRKAEDDVQEWITNARKVNGICASNEIPLRLLPGDLEYSVLQMAKKSTIRDFAQKAGKRDDTNKNDFMRWLGSKGLDGSARQNAFKAPWFRGYIGQHIPSSEIHDDIKGILLAWLIGAMQRKEAANLLAKLR